MGLHSLPAAADFGSVTLECGLCLFLFNPAHKKDLWKRSLRYWYARSFPEIVLRLGKLFNRFFSLRLGTNRTGFSY